MCVCVCVCVKQMKQRERKGETREKTVATRPFSSSLSLSLSLSITTSFPLSEWPPTDLISHSLSLPLLFPAFSRPSLSIVHRSFSLSLSFSRSTHYDCTPHLALVPRHTPRLPLIHPSCPPLPQRPLQEFVTRDVVVARENGKLGFNIRGALCALCLVPCALCFALRAASRRACLTTPCLEPAGGIENDTFVTVDLPAVGPKPNVT